MTSNPRIPFVLSTDRPPLPAPDGKNIIVHLVVNVENWRFDSAMPRKLLSAPHGKESIPDVPNFSWAEYGMRCGMPRIMSLLDEFNLPSSCALNAGVIANYPRLSARILEMGWEIIGHGLHQKALSAEASEEEIIAEAIDTIETFTGVDLKGWLGPGLRESTDTPDILKAHGIRYCCDWVLDDLPAWMQTKHGPLIAMPYSLELNDSVLHAVQHNPSDALYERTVETLATFEAERHLGPRIMAIGLHPHLIAVPHRLGTLRRILELLCERSDTIFMTGNQIADWYERHEPSSQAAVPQSLSQAIS